MSDFPTQDQCDSCFDDMAKKVDHVVNVAKNAIINMNNSHEKSIEDRNKDSIEFYKKQDVKYDKFLDRADKMASRKSILDIFILGVFASIFAYTYMSQIKINEKVDTEILNMTKSIDKKIDRAESPTLNEIKMLRELGDEYNRKIFVKKTDIGRIDTSAYYWAKKNIYGSELRGGTKN